MRISSPILAFLTFAAAAAGSGASAPLHFDNMPLGNVVRILSARYHAPVTLTAGAQAPITGDLTGMDVRQALAEAARQAGLVVVALGTNPADGFSLGPPPPPGPGPDKDGVDTAAAARRRAELLRRRAELLKAALLGGGDPAP